MELFIESLGAQQDMERRPVEMVERKGLGHPDTICDALTERLSVELCRFYLEKFGFILHHNLDKALLWGGVSRPAFGGGEVLQPMELYLAGRATLDYRGVSIPIDEMAREAVDSWFREHFHAFDPQRHLKLHSLIRPGSSELVDLFERQHKSGVYYANDTSCGTGFAPLSRLERLTLAVEKKLNDPATKAAHPEIGEDVKVMSVRHGQAIDLTVACAMVDRHVDDIQSYAKAKERVADIVRKTAADIAGQEVSVQVNTADDLEAGDIYLTVTGTSAESGDDGEAGRGNRANGLITPYRPMTMESVAGKNPVTHVGKIYNLAAQRLAERLVAGIADIAEARCFMVSRIGHPVSDPQALDIRLAVEEGGRPPADMEAEVREIAMDELAGLRTLWREILDGKLSLF